MESSSDQSSRLWRIRRTASQMLNDRGYMVPAEDLQMTLDAFRQEFGELPEYVDDLQCYRLDDGC